MEMLGSIQLGKAERLGNSTRYPGVLRIYSIDRMVIEIPVK